MSAAEQETLAQTIERQRQALFRAGAVINVCAIACINDTTDPDELADALRTAAQMIDDVAAVLEEFTKDD